MNAARLHNALRILLSLDCSDLINGGVVDQNWGTAEASARDQVAAFLSDPAREALRMPDANFDRLFALVESRQPESEASALEQASPDMHAALIAAKQEMWLAARSAWSMADFKNWAIVQQIDAALEKADRKPRTGAVVAKAEEHANG
jgi:hypothetical protein